MLARLYRLDYLRQNAALPLRQAPVAFRVSPRRPRRDRQVLPRLHRQLQRRGHHQHHPAAARLPALYRAPPLQLLRRGRAASPRVEHRAAAKPRRHPPARRYAGGKRLRHQARAARPLQLRLLQGRDVQESQKPHRSRRRHAQAHRRPAGPRPAPRGRSQGARLYGARHP